MAKKTETEVQVAADAKKEAEIAAAESAGVTEKAQPVTENERVMYVGPTVPGIGIQNRVYTEIPSDAKEVIRENPQIGNLFIRIRDYQIANKMLREKKGYIYSAFLRAEEIMIENANKAAGNPAETETEESG
jgi:hypothetical protein